jgi:hypothetical protein
MLWDSFSSFREEYRDPLLEEMHSAGDVGAEAGLESIAESLGVNNKETNGHYAEDTDEGEVSEDEASDDAKPQMKPTKQNELADEPMSPTMQELAQIVAICIHEIGSGRLPKQAVDNMIETHGSAILKQFWKTK